MKNVAILDPNAQKVLVTFSFILKEVFNLQAAGITTLVVFESWQHH